MDTEKALLDETVRSALQQQTEAIVDEIIRGRPMDSFVQEEIPFVGTLVVEKIVKKTITRCFHECPYFDLDGGPGPMMVCTHPDAPDRGYIISHPYCDEGFPNKCPLAAH